MKRIWCFYRLGGCSSRELSSISFVVRAVAGIDHIGVGSDFGGSATMPSGLEDVSRFPALFAELAERGYSDDDLAKVAGRNVLRVMRDAERVSVRLRAD